MILLSKLPFAPPLIVGALLSGSVAAAEPDSQDPHPRVQPDDTWISLSGTVDEVQADRFTLDYGGGLIGVEMDDGDRDADAYRLLEGDKVVVTGVIDDDLFETATIDANSVYIDKLHTYYSASDADQEDSFVTILTPVEPGSTVIQGTVTKIVGEREFMVDTGTRSLEVETYAMAGDQLDDKGPLQIDVGDKVSVTGEVDYNIIEDREFVAESIVELD